MRLKSDISAAVCSFASKGAMGFMATIVLSCVMACEPMKGETFHVVRPDSLSPAITAPRPDILVPGIDFSADSLSSAIIDAAIEDTSTDRNIIQRVIDYFSDSNNEPEKGEFDISFLGGPSYSSSTSVELALIAAGVYRTGPRETTPLSELDVFAEGSVTGFYNVGTRGHHSFPNDRIRVNYHASFCHFPSKFWGVGYEMGADKNNETNYTLLQSLISGEFLWHLPHDIFLGPSVYFDYSKGTKAKNTEVWKGEPLEQLSYGLGFVFSIDTRDIATNASQGYNLRLHQRFFPTFLGNKRGFSITELTFGWYHRFWKSGIMAFQFHGCGATEHTPWSMLSAVDASSGIRGYYERRYRDRGEIDAVVELRQHIWRRNGIVIWAGVGSVFHRLDQINFKRLLPSFGLGYRWEFKKRVNVRLDYGIGKGQSSFYFNINEAF